MGLSVLLPAAGLVLAVGALIIYLLSTGALDDGNDGQAADFGTPTWGCNRGCCMNPGLDGTDCVEGTIPCKDRTDGRHCFKRFIGGEAGCPNFAGAGGMVAPPDSYRQFETCFTHSGP
jgi:hypothetical protein